MKTHTEQKVQNTTSNAVQRILTLAVVIITAFSIPLAYPCDEINPDDDGDGVCNNEDSHPNNPALWDDWNYNGYSDSWENLDPDGDGISNINDTHPYDPSRYADYDDDGLDTIYETTVYFTDYLDPDTDNDGYSDGDEVLVRFTDPLDPNSH